MKYGLGGFFRAGIFLSAVFALGCVRYVNYGAVDQMLHYRSSVNCLNECGIPFEELNGKKVSIEITGYAKNSDDGYLSLLKDVIEKGFIRRGITLVSDGAADYKASFRTELNDENTSSLWIPLIYQKKTRAFFVKLKVIIIDNSTGKIIFEKDGIANSTFSEYFFFEILGPVKKWKAEF